LLPNSRRRESWLGSTVGGVDLGAPFGDREQVPAWTATTAIWEVITRVDPPRLWGLSCGDAVESAE
jgi:hypothetical protein